MSKLEQAVEAIRKLPSTYAKRHAAAIAEAATFANTHTQGVRNVRAVVGHTAVGLRNVVEWTLLFSKTFTRRVNLFLNFILSHNFHATVIHELGHAFMIFVTGNKIISISAGKGNAVAWATIFSVNLRINEEYESGGYCELEGKFTHLDNLLISFAGPAANFLLTGAALLCNYLVLINFFIYPMYASIYEFNIHAMLIVVFIFCTKTTIFNFKYGIYNLFQAGDDSDGGEMRKVLKIYQMFSKSKANKYLQCLRRIISRNK